MCFTEPEWKFLNDEYHEVRNFNRLSKIHKSNILEYVRNTQNDEIICNQVA